jgi:AcrR family transcriptional regulator
MVLTPWGETEEFRRQKLAPGLRLEREAVARSQRERLFGAMVATVAERGYEATSVADLIAVSGVSRTAFYEHFEDKRDCFQATLEAFLAAAGSVVSLNYDGRGSALRAFIELIVEQSAAGRMFFIESYPAGAEAVALTDRAMAGVERLYTEAFAARPQEAMMPTELVGAIVGGLRRIIYKHLLQRRETELLGLVEEIWSWSFGYEPPPLPLRARRGRTRRAAPSLDQSADVSERIIRGATEAIAEKSYAAATIAEIAERAPVSLSTFYAHFGSKEAVYLAALDAGQARMFAAMLPVFRRTRGWPQATRAGLEAMLGFLAFEPEFARISIVEILRSGRKPVELRDRTVEVMKRFLKPGFELAPGLSPLVGDAVVGAVGALLYNQLQADGPQSLPQAAPLASYIVLSPFIGAAEACAVARGDR